MDRYEEAVLEYITGDRHRFVSPQFHIQYSQDAKQGGSCPDFVVLDYKERAVFVVEVTTDSNLSKITSKLIEREHRWIAPLKIHFSRIDSCFASWEFRTTVFMREKQIARMIKMFQNVADISFIGIETINFPYSWEWSGTTPINPLR